MTPEGLTDSWLSSVLQTEVKVGDTSRIGDGLVGMNIRLELASDGSVPTSMIAKLPSPDPTSRATGIALRNYEREVNFYLRDRADGRHPSRPVLPRRVACGHR